MVSILDAVYEEIITSWIVRSKWEEVPGRCRPRPENVERWSIPLVARVGLVEVLRTHIAGHVKVNPRRSAMTVQAHLCLPLDPFEVHLCVRFHMT